MLIALFLPFLAALLLALPLGKYRDWAIRLTPILPLGLVVYFAIAAQQTSGVVAFSWMEQFGLSLDLHPDGLAFLFILLIAGIGTAIFTYAGAYMHHHKHRQRLMAFLMLFMGAMLGLVLADNLLTLFIFWELTSISSFFLIGFNNEEAPSRKSALTALAITGGGGLLMLIGIIALGAIGETFSIAGLIAQSQELKQHPQFLFAMVFLLLGAFTKSAQFPFHFWLPGAMKAPTPVSAYLHSATMVKAGIYLLARLSPIFNGYDYWNTTLLVVGGLTMLYAAFQAIFQTDMKSILAYSTVSALGILVFLIGLGSQEALLAAAAFILVHGLYKATLFMVTGIVDHETHSRDVSKLSGLRKVMPLVALAALLAALSNAGMPPFVGFIGKDLIYESTLHFGWGLTIIAVLTNILLLVAGFLAGLKPFAGPLQPVHANVHTPAVAMWLPPLILGATGLLVGVFPFLIDGRIIGPAYAAIAASAYQGHLALWHGFNTILILSATTLVVGGLLYWILRPKHQNWLQQATAIGPKSWFDGLGNLFHNFAAWWTNFFQNGKLRLYLLTVLGFSIVLIAFEVFTATSFTINYRLLTEVTFYEGAIIAVLLTAVILTVFSSSRLASVAAMGVIGLTICIIFVFYSAPDLAITQFTIDTLTVILFVLVLYKLPRFIPLRWSWRHLMDGLVSLSFGFLISIITLEVLTKSPNRDISAYYAQNSYVLAKGKNIVNVILVDFRGADTMIEIVVLSIAAIGVFSLLKLRLPKNERIE